MQKLVSVSLLMTGILLVAHTPSAEAGKRRGDRVALYHAQQQPWHGDYYHTSYGYPLALVVPPTSNAQVDMGWGVTHTETRPIDHQFLRPFPGDFAGGDRSVFLPTPPWPSHTRQFGVYSVRGPW